MLEQTSLPNIFLNLTFDVITKIKIFLYLYYFIISSHWWILKTEAPKSVPNIAICTKQSTQNSKSKKTESEGPGLGHMSTLWPREGREPRLTVLTWLHAMGESSLKKNGKFIIKRRRKVCRASKNNGCLLHCHMFSPCCQI